MYVEERMYLLQVGKAPEYFKHYEETGMQIQLRHLPNTQFAREHRAEKTGCSVESRARIGIPG